MELKENQSALILTADEHGEILAVCLRCLELIKEK